MSTPESLAYRLANAGCIAPKEEAAELLDAAPDEPTLEAWVRRREDGEPLAWIVGTVRFCGLAMHVDAGVFVPRPQTEALARRAAAVLPAGGRALDLCTGSGAVAAAMRAFDPSATVIGVDISPAAAVCARRNGIPALVGDLGAPLRDRSFDVITAVAPYVPADELRLLPSDVLRYEPRAALDGGDDGLDVVRRVVAAAARLLRPGGWLLTEVGERQDRTLAPALEAAGFVEVQAWDDEESALRGLAARIRG